ncbi:CBS domain-containing protein [Pyrobaculum neutrophilum]|uniref:Signal transduction protein with CBS domains n=1 Tax=Pyrobaculum neutrophilum (strain DSM 2338 / JCM 9278 / NBRC 100436 / V24Sta) TaxID=444157 RepID=B1YBY1_PYRNV|nr:CBS domain-containing protein [Pyrobaculum neutrophilum]ACB39365.1 putative signal transduction protein with CBS domains [Pyrobaculum neutrophilum V24Sta]
MDKVGNYIRREPITVPPGATLREAVKIMAQYNVGLVVIADQARRPVGVLSERDIIRAVAAGRTLDAKVEEVGTVGNILTVKKDEDIYTAIKAMRSRGVRHVVVVNEDGTVAGVLSIRDLVEDRALKTLGDRAWWPPPEE